MEPVFKRAALLAGAPSEKQPSRKRRIPRNPTSRAWGPSCGGATAKSTSRLGLQRRRWRRARTAGRLLRRWSGRRRTRRYNTSQRLPTQATQERRLSARDFVPSVAGNSGESSLAATDIESMPSDNLASSRPLLGSNDGLSRTTAVRRWCSSVERDPHRRS